MRKKTTKRRTTKAKSSARRPRKANGQFKKKR